MPLGYTTRSQVEQYQNHVYDEVSDAEFNNYISAAEFYINNYTGYNAQTTLSGMLTETVTREKVDGKVDNYGNLVIQLMKPPVHFDSNSNPLVTLVEYNFGGIRVPLTLTDGSADALNTVLEVSENRKKIIYPSIYFLPYLPTVTPTQKANLFNLKDVKFWVDVSYTGGYDTLPQDVVQATNILVGDMLEHRNNPNYSISIRQGSYQQEFLPRTSRFVKGEPVNQAVAVANLLLDPYVRYTW